MTKVKEKVSANGCMASGLLVSCAHDAIVPLEEVIGNPRNPNKHPDRQIGLLAKMIKHQGWRNPIVVSRRSGFVVTGHGRLAAARLLALETVPVDYQDFNSEADEYAHLIADNRIAELAHLDVSGVSSIVADLEKWNSEFDLELTGLTEKEISKLHVSATAEIEEAQAKGIEEESNDLGVFGLRGNEVVFSSTGKFGIPDLINDQLIGAPDPLGCWAGPNVCVDSPGMHWIYIWGTDSKRGMPAERSIVAFYTEDYRFDVFWDKPAEYVGKLLNSGILGAITPNYSLWNESPEAVQIFNTYRARWVGRYMQEAGIGVIPDVCVSPKSMEFSFVGIPKGLPCVAYQVQTMSKSIQDISTARIGFREILKQLAPQQILLYVSEAWQKVLPPEDFPKSLDVRIVENRWSKKTTTSKKNGN